MKFPGQRKRQHYFPIESRHNAPQENTLVRTHICGVSQTLVDIEAHVDDALLERYGVLKGNSMLMAEAQANQLYQELCDEQRVVAEYAGGTIGNTLHNFSMLSDEKAVMFAVMNQSIELNSLAFRYLMDTSSKVDMSHLHPIQGSIGRAFTLVTPDGERSFAISKGAMDKLDASAIKPELVQNSAALVFASYLMRSAEGDNIDQAAKVAIEAAKAGNVPVVLTLGTRFLIAQDPAFWQQFIQEHVNVIAMNEQEAEALTGEADPLKACEIALQWCDLVLCTAGPQGLYIGGFCDEAYLRETDFLQDHPNKPEFNRHEFSRPMRHSDCAKPVKVFSHIAPYQGGPQAILNTNGAGDGALAALLHDMAANQFHKLNMPDSSKHRYPALAYSSFSQICKYANRVSYQVLRQHGPRLSQGLPEREESLENAYWEK